MFKSLLIATAMLVVVGCSSKKENTSKNNAKAEVKTNIATKVQTTCPVMEGNPINKKLYVDALGKKIYYCCGGCAEAIKKDPKKYIDKLEAQGIMLEDTPK